MMEIGEGSPLAWQIDPLEALARWPVTKPALLLHSGRHHPRWARRSILTHGAGTFRFQSMPDGSGHSQWLGDPGVIDAAAFHHKPFHDLRLLLNSPTAPGIWVGYLGYDLGRWVERLPNRAAADRHWPIIELAWCPGWLVYDTARQSWAAGGTWAKGGHPTLSDPAPTPAPPISSDLHSVFTRREYEAAVAKVLGYIAAGDIFQANLAQRFTGSFTDTSPEATRGLFARLNAASPAWYGAYMEFAPAGPDQGRAIASTSPELFLEVDARGNVVTRPIKGTRSASVPAEELLHSEKDAAELNMIVDLLRNDLGRVCAYGSVTVPEPRVIESHPTVHHGVATITGRLHAQQDIVDLLRATMPGGSVTGAPKIRAMEIIDELEPVRRGPYCGAIGFLSQHESQLNIAIRTLLVEQPAPDPGPAPSPGRVDFSVGGGIVADSDPGREFEETLHKAAAMLRALGIKGGS